MQRYAITDRVQYDTTPAAPLDALVQQAARWANQRIDFIQLREKGLSAGQQVELTHRVLQAVRSTGSATRVLVNGRLDVALATAAHGVHLTSAAGELTAAQVRALYLRARLPAPYITVSCHTLQDIARARTMPVDAILFGPVFGKRVKTTSGAEVLPGLGLDALHDACTVAAPIPVFALGGITPENAPFCEQAGATGIAAIRLFAEL